MAHLVMDTLIGHVLEFTILPAQIEARRLEWNAVLAATSRSEYIKLLCAFAGLELLEYDNADVRRDMTGAFRVVVRSRQWREKQPA